jgi:hypothetical protein
MSSQIVARNCGLRVVGKITNKKRSDYETKAFDKEVTASASIRDPNIVSAIDVGTTEDGFGFIVKEYLTGDKSCRAVNPFVALLR